MQNMMSEVLSIVLTLLGPTVTNFSSLPIECRMTVNSSVLHSSSGFSISRLGILIHSVNSSTFAMLSVTSPPSMPLKALSCNIFRNSSLIFSSEVVIIFLLNASTSYRVYGIRHIIGEQIRRLDCKTQYAVLSKRFDTSYPTGGYGVSGDQSEHKTI
ncbi:hypothetical protein Tco_0603586 [Tanacetum coccineum]